jgi:hypothetical protein
MNKCVLKFGGITLGNPFGRQRPRYKIILKWSARK